MTVTASFSPDRRAIQRARQALQCLPLRLAFYRELEQDAISSNQLSSRADWERLCCQQLGSRRWEDHFIWLIQLGVLRREVDGQGLTERVRLTPLGREVLTIWSDEIPQAGPWLRLRCWFKRLWPRL